MKWRGAKSGRKMVRCHLMRTFFLVVKSIFCIYIYTILYNYICNIMYINFYVRDLVS